MYNRNMEIREAIDAGERALRSLREAKSSLGSARGWGIVDIIGGRGLSGLIKHVKIGDERAALTVRNMIWTGSAGNSLMFGIFRD